VEDSAENSHREKWSQVAWFRSLRVSSVTTFPTKSFVATATFFSAAIVVTAAAVLVQGDPV